MSQRSPVYSGPPAWLFRRALFCRRTHDAQFRKLFDFTRDGCNQQRSGVEAKVMASGDLRLLERVLARLGDAVIDPAIWPELMSEICQATGATSGILLETDVRTSDVPRTPEFEAAIQVYFRDGWYANETRAKRAAPLLLAGRKVVIEEDILTPDEIRRGAQYYCEIRCAACKADIG